MSSPAQTEFTVPVLKPGISTVEDDPDAVQRIFRHKPVTKPLDLLQNFYLCPGLGARFDYRFSQRHGIVYATRMAVLRLPRCSGCPGLFNPQRHGATLFYLLKGLADRRNSLFDSRMFFYQSVPEPNILAKLVFLHGGGE